MDSKQFLIFALPRSRTSWLSVLLTTSESFCAHDHSAYARKLPEVWPGHYSGMCCTGAMMEWRYWMELYPEARVLVIRRDKKDVITSFAKVLEVTEASIADQIGIMDATLDEVEEQPGVVSIRFDEIDERMHDIFHFCLPTLHLSTFRQAQLSGMQIQPIASKMLAEIERLVALA